MLDLLLLNGTVLDGAGRPATRADIGVADGRIAAIGELAQAEARTRLDAADRCVCPGFIDVHSHSDAYLLIAPDAPSKIYQGVTTEVVGNCGASAAPLTGQARLPSDWSAFAYPGAWRTMAEYRQLLAAVRPAVNVVPLVGHNVIRAGVMGYDGRPATAAETAAMARLLEQSLDEGGRGLSTGLVYAPGLFAAQDEIRALAAVVGRRGGIYTSHMRSEGKHLLAALDETLGVGEATGVRVQVSHLKTAGQANWGLLDAALAKLDAAQRAGVAVRADRYPYTASCTDLDVMFPDWAAAGGRDAVLARLRDPAERRRLRDDLCAARDERYWDTVIVGSTTPRNRACQGQPLRAVAAQLGMEPVDAVLYLTDTDDLRTGAFFMGMSEANMWRILALPYVMIASDASLRAPSGPLGQDHPHPRAYGTFPRFLRAALDGRTVALPEAVRKMTALPADQFALADRGVIAVGKAADLVVFDPGAVADRATYSVPHQFATGIETVVVNGVVTLTGGRLTGVRGGQVL
jgi:N-acyl-D-amino-acid deacylase